MPLAKNVLPVKHLIVACLPGYVSDGAQIAAFAWAIPEYALSKPGIHIVGGTIQSLSGGFYLISTLLYIGTYLRE